MAIRAAFHDIDGVVVLSEPLHQEKIIRTAARYGVPIDLETEWFDELAGIGDHRIYHWICAKAQRMNAEFPLTEEQFLRECEQYYLANAGRLEARPTHRDAFMHMAALGIHQASVSSGVRAQVQCNLQTAGLLGRMAFALSADDMAPGETKPHPAPYLKALAQLNDRLRTADPAHIDILPGECLVIEDSKSGAQSGIAAGMVTVHWVLEDSQAFHPRADYCLKAGDSLLDCVSAITRVSGAGGAHACI